MIGLLVQVSNTLVGQNVGIGTSTPQARLHVADSSVLFTGPANYSTNIRNPPASGAGSRMMWYADKGAFRSGLVSGTNWDKDSIGLNSFAIGLDTKANGYYSAAMGIATTSSGQNSMAMGAGTIASGSSSTAMGEYTIASGNISTALGYRTIASGNISTALGYGTKASGNISTALGFETRAKAVEGFSIGAYNDDTDNPFSYEEDATDRLFQIGNGTVASRRNAITVLRNGNTGIGNTDPTFILDVSKRIRLRSENASLTAGIWFNKNDNSALNTFVGNDLNNNLQIYSYVGNRTIASFNITTGGFRVEGPASLNSGNAIGSFGGYGDFVVDKPGVVGGRFTIKENGNVGIGTNSPSQVLHVVGNILASGTITPSDIRYKTNIHIIPNAIYKLMQLNGVYYHLRSEEFPQMGFSANEQVGLIAQEVEAVMPNVVITNVDGYKGVDYAKLVPLLIESIKELNKKLEEQQKQIELLSKHVK